MDGFLRILENTSSKIICTRLQAWNFGSIFMDVSHTQDISSKTIAILLATVHTVKIYGKYLQIFWTVGNSFFHKLYSFSRGTWLLQKRVKRRVQKLQQPKLKPLQNFYFMCQRYLTYVNYLGDLLGHSSMYYLTALLDSIKHQSY